MKLVDKFRGNVITLVGSPASGKTYLGNILKERLDAVMLYEHPSSGFPDKIKSNLKNQENLLETILFFRNIQIENHMKAIEIANSNKTVIIDTPFYQNQLYIDLYIEDEFSREVLYHLGEHDMNAYKPSDVTIYISTTPELVKKYLKKRYGERMWEEDSWSTFISKMPPKVDAHIQKIKDRIPNLLTIYRGTYDFKNDSDKEKMYKLLSNVDI